MATGDRRDPYKGYNFRVEIDGITRAGFRECSGLEVTHDLIEYREGDEGLTTRKLSGMVRYSNISLRRGISDDQDLWVWHNATTTGNIERRNGSVILLNDTGDELARWNFREGWPVRWAGPSFNATSQEVAIESLDIAHEGLSRQ